MTWDCLNMNPKLCRMMAVGRFWGPGNACRPRVYKSLRVSGFGGVRVLNPEASEQTSLLGSSQASPTEARGLF